jgi:hypothetical protein
VRERSTASSSSATAGQKKEKTKDIDESTNQNYFMVHLNSIPGLHWSSLMVRRNTKKFTQSTKLTTKFIVQTLTILAAFELEGKAYRLEH